MKSRSVLFSLLLLIACLLVGGQLVAQGDTWTPPFNHNLQHNIIGTYIGQYSDPYGPWRPNGQPILNPNLATAPASMGLVTLQNYTYQWPQPGASSQSFNAVHMALIPKGRYRGMVLVWSVDPVLALHPPIYLQSPHNLTQLPGNQRMSYQPCAIVDPADVPTVVDPAVGQPFRFRNFLVPLGVYDITNPTFQAQDLFCAGQTWSPFGDLIVAGGTDFNVAGTYFNGAVVTMAFNPRRAFSDYPGVSVSLYPGFDGMWRRGPDLEHKRWYPTTTLTHRLQRLADATHPSGREVVFTGGGSNDNGSNLPQDNPTWNNYEALVINQEATALNEGYVKDFVQQGATTTYTWNGPGVDATAFEVDWLYEYPRFHLLSNGLLFFSGYTPRASSVDHNAAPGIWTMTPGQPGSKYSSNWPRMRYDAPSFLFPNLGGGASDIVYRLGGCDEHWYLPAAGNGAPNGTTPTMESIHAAVPNATWQAAASMPTTNTTNGGRFLTNAVILPTGGILVLGGLHRAPNTPQGLNICTKVYQAQTV